MDTGKTVQEIRGEERGVLGGMIREVERQVIE